MISFDPQTSSAIAEELPADTTYPCSYTQVRIWFAQQMDPDSAQWNVAMRWRLEGRLREAIVERAWQILLDRHEALRTGIEEVDGLPLQRVRATSRLKFATIDLSRLPPAQRDTAAAEISEKEAITPILLRPDGQNFRVQFVRLDEHTAYLLTTFHHIIVDGWSVGVLMREFGEIVSRLATGETPALPALPLQLVDYALWQTDTLAGGGFDADRAYWKSALGDLGRFELPTDKPRAALWSHDSDIRTLLLPRDLSDCLTRFAGRHACTPFHIATATLSAVLSRMAGSTDVVLGTQVACRNQSELASLVGPLINTVVLRLDASGDPSLLDLVDRCKSRSLEALEHQQLPFNFVVEDLQTRRDASRHPVHSISITTQSAHIDTGAMQDLEFGGLRIVALPSFPVGAMQDLEFFMVGREEGWRLSCIANTSLFEIATVDRLLERWAHAVEVLVERDAATRLSLVETLPGRRFSPSRVAGPAATPDLRTGGAETQAVAAAEDDRSADLRDFVAAVWTDVLGGVEIAGKTDFFEAGGNSLTALRMVSRVNSRLNGRASIRKLFSHSQFRSFLATLQEPQVAAAPPPTATPARQSRAISPVIALNQGAAYRIIARGLGDRHPVIDVPVGDADDAEFAKAHSFRELAARIALRVAAAQPEGPFTLMAYCALGPLALEVARDLTAQGRKVGSLILLNTFAPDYYEVLTPAARRIRKRAALREAWQNFNVLRGLHRRGEITTAMFLEHYSIFRKLGLPRLLGKAMLVDSIPAESHFETLLEFPGILRRSLLAAPPLPGPVACDAIVVRTSDILKGPSFPPALGWMKWVSGQVRICDVEGTHANLLQDPTASEIGRRLADAFDDLESAREAKAGTA